MTWPSRSMEAAWPNTPASPPPMLRATRGASMASSLPSPFQSMNCVAVSAALPQRLGKAVLCASKHGSPGVPTLRYR